MTKTYEDCLDEVARNYNWKDWNGLLKWHKDGSLWREDNNLLIELHAYQKEAALLYGESKFQEGCKHQGEVDFKIVTDILTKPTFKP